MTRQQAVSYFLEKRPSDYHPAVDRMARLMEALGNPQDRLRFAHVAGTNGKGSVSCLLASALQAAGYRTGLYTSPHLNDFSERIRVDGAPIGDDAIIEAAERVRETETRLGLTLAAFDRMTAAAFLYFERQACEIVVLEVGLGGLLDATNVIRESAVSVITNIGLDHTQVLGDTVEKIAGEKAGIVKAGCPVVFYDDGRESVRAVIAAVCREKGSALTCTDFSLLKSESADLHGQVFTYREHRSVPLALAGEYQLRNAAAALDALDVLKTRGFPVAEEAICAGFAAARWPGRFELLREKPPFLVDGGHNPQCAAALVQNLAGVFGEEKVVFLIGMLRDKDARTVIETLAPRAKAAVAVTVEDPRAMPSEELAALLKEQGIPCLEAKKLTDAAAIADELADGAPVCAFGSLYFTGEMRAVFGRR